MLRQGQEVVVEVEDIGSILAQGENSRRSRRFQGPDDQSALAPFLLSSISVGTSDVFRIRLRSAADEQVVFANSIAPLPLVLHDADRTVVDPQD
ncbi:MAG: hypothetical protein ACK58T_41420, partial [Phycisphaerae bacterium]